MTTTILGYMSARCGGPNMNSFKMASDGMVWPSVPVLKRLWAAVDY